jgi:hypothetical protein
MAFINPYQIPNTSIILPEAFWRIEAIHGTKYQMCIVVKIYATELDADVKATSVGQEEYNYSPSLRENGDLATTTVDKDGKVIEYISDFISQGYAYILNLPGFEEAKQV